MSKCIYCGENPISHPPFFFYESLDIFVAPIRRMIAYIIPLNMESFAPDWVLLTFFKLLSFIGIISYNNDIKDVRNNRARVLWEEAARRGIKITEIRLFGKPIDAYDAELKSGRHMLYFGLPRPRGNDHALQWLDDKGILMRRLRRKEIPVPDGGSYWFFPFAYFKFQKLNKPVIVKPRKGSRGRHTSTFVYTTGQFIKAYRIAKKLCFWIIVQEQLTGDVFRGTVIGGKLVGVLGGSHPKVIGDGMHTIEQLVEIVNKNKNPKVKDITITDGTKLFLKRQGLDLGTVLPSGRIVELSEKVGISYGGTSYEVLDTTHSDTKKMLEKAAAVINSPILGFDFIIPDITKSCHEQKWGIIECNGAPFINLHHDPLIGKPQNIAKHVWDLVLK